MIKYHNKINPLQYFYFYINHILVDVPLKLSHHPIFQIMSDLDEKKETRV